MIVEPGAVVFCTRRWGGAGAPAWHRPLVVAVVPTDFVRRFRWPPLASAFMRTVGMEMAWSHNAKRDEFERHSPAYRPHPLCRRSSNRSAGRRTRAAAATCSPAAPPAVRDQTVIIPDPRWSDAQVHTIVTQGCPRQREVRGLRGNSNACGVCIAACEMARKGDG